MKCYKRIIAFFLTFAMLVSMLSFASAAEPAGVLEDSASVAAWNTYIAGNLKDGASASSAQTAFWRNRDQALSNAGIGELASYAQLTKVTSALNRSGGGLVLQIADFIVDTICSLFSSPDYLVMYDSSFGCFRPYDNRTGLWVVNSMGHFPYYPVDSSDESTDNTDPTQQLTYHWIRASEVNWSSGKAIVSYTELKEIIGLGYDGIVYQRSNYLHVKDDTGIMILCTEEGYPLSAIADMEGTAVGTPNNYYTDEGDQVTNNITNIDQGETVNNQFIDITDNSVWFPDGTLQYIDSIYYDESTKTYYVDSHDSYTYNSETNTYITNNYTYEYNYHIDYTSVTYIGQTEEYDEEYRYYYELPDGRSSADLTAEDLEQLSLVFSDVIQYSRTADNIDQRALYHFDGNTEDSSYWSYCSDFDWSSGASLTYMDEGTFNGSLYLDETEHDFTITLPNNDAAGDWTLQFRYYQSYTAAPVTDSYLKVGEHIVLQFTGAQYLYASGDVLAATSIGTWNELCLIRSNGVLYYYINGVYYGSVADAVYHNQTINFHFGSEQQTYKKLDELRFTSSVIYSPGQDYTPSAVPFDSNLTLVLPDNGTLEEQGLMLVPSENNLLTAVGLDDWTSMDVVENLYENLDGFKYGENVDGYEFPDINGGPYLVYNSETTTFVPKDNAVSVNFSTSEAEIGRVDGDGAYHYIPAGSMVLPVVYYVGSDLIYSEDHAGAMGFKPGISYTFSVVFDNGEYSYITFHTAVGGSFFNSLFCTALVSCESLQFEYHTLGCAYSTNDSSTGMLGIRIQPRNGASFNIIHMELVEGTQPEFQFTKTYSTFVGDPEPAEVIPDEFTTITKPVASSNLLISKNLDDWSDSSVTNYLTPFSGSGNVVSSIPVGSMSLIYNSSAVSFTDGGSFITVNFGGNTPYVTDDDNITNPLNSLFFPIYRNEIGMYYENFSETCGLQDLGTYTLSVVLADGSSSTVTFRITDTGSAYNRRKLEILSRDINSAILFGDSLACGYPGSNLTNENAFYYRFVGIPIYLAEGTTADILYMELVQGTEAEASSGHQTSIYNTTDLSGAPLLAVRTNRTITGYQFGGVRPSYPEKGQVWAMIEGGRIRSLQQYTGSAWVEVDGRIWTGSRWIPYSSYDVFLLKDCHDILGTVSDPDYEYIYSESGFWAWFQRQWLAFMAKVDQLLEAVRAISVPGGSAVEDEDIFPGVGEDLDGDGVVDGESWGVLDLLVTVKDGVWNFVTGVVSAGFDGLTDFVVGIVRMDDLFDAFDEDNENGIFISVEVGGSVWD